jgi:RNA polymerase sigma-70 factor (ECF subfamily)
MEDDSVESHIRQLMQGRNVEESFHWLFLRFHSAVSGFFFRKGFSSEDCRDLTQDVFFAVYTGVKNLRSEAAFVTWLFSIAHNTALRHWERQKKHARLQLVHSRDSESGDQATEAEVERVAAPGPDPLSQLLDLERVEVVGDALKKLPGREHDCLRASLVDNLTYKEIGERLGISENTVAVHIHRALKSLRKRLGGEHRKSKTSLEVI